MPRLWEVHIGGVMLESKLLRSASALNVASLLSTMAESYSLIDVPRDI
jgi:hypothetical protein